MIAAIRRAIAARRLQRIVTERANSRDVAEYRMRRAAGKLGYARKEGKA